MPRKEGADGGDLSGRVPPDHILGVPESAPGRHSHEKDEVEVVPSFEGVMIDENDEVERLHMADRHVPERSGQECVGKVVGPTADKGTDETDKWALTSGVLHDKLMDDLAGLPHDAALCRTARAN